MATTKRFALDLRGRPVPVLTGVATTHATQATAFRHRGSRKRALLFVYPGEDEELIDPCSSFAHCGAYKPHNNHDWPAYGQATVTDIWATEPASAPASTKAKAPTTRPPQIHASLARAQSATLKAPADLTFAVLFSQGQIAADQRGNGASSGGRRRAPAHSGGRRAPSEVQAEAWPPWELLSVLWCAACDALDEAGREAMQQAREFVDFVSGTYHRRGMRWLSLCRSLSVRDLPVEPGAMPHDSSALIRADLPRLQATPSDKSSVESILRSFCDMYPGVGYNQGFDSACLAMFIATGRNSSVTLAVFSKWAAQTGLFMFDTPEGEIDPPCEKAAAYARSVLLKYSPYVFPWLWRDPVMTGDYEIGESEILLANVFLRPLVSLCSRLNFRRAVVTEIVDRVLHLAEDSPAVSLWVACTLLCLAAAEDERDGCSKGEVISVATRMDQVSAKVTSFQSLERAASIPLWTFIGGFRASLGCPG